MLFAKKEQCHFLTHDYFTIIFLAVPSLTPEQLFVAQGLAMSDFSLTLVLQFKTSKIIYGMANIIKKSRAANYIGNYLSIRRAIFSSL